MKNRRFFLSFFFVFVAKSNFNWIEIYFSLPLKIKIVFSLNSNSFQSIFDLPHTLKKTIFFLSNLSSEWKKPNDLRLFIQPTVNEDSTAALTRPDNCAIHDRLINQPGLLFVWIFFDFFFWFLKRYLIIIVFSKMIRNFHQIKEQWWDKQSMLH